MEEAGRKGGYERTSESPLLLLIGPGGVKTPIGQPVCCRQWRRS
ncbi:hypothetical protein C4K22_0105 [Pseudomonas chlororaphis subsp. aurantiaca]|nr:hypothetical protein C4K22_0105 [Pseudomonas chlororaphis subsp. aurantiaca]AZD39217.1 hypothetical protein C4K21_0105 [Pseudomonas chlororaphis subsp. aurantiaca]